MKMLVLICAGLTAAASSPACAQVMSPAEYVQTAGASDLYERESAALVLQTTKNAGVRSFAQMMQGAHTQSTADVKAAAAKSRTAAPPPVLTPAQTEMIAQLGAEQGPARDAAYIAQQRAAHGQALAVQKAYAADGTAPALRAAAAGIVPVVEHHIMLLMKM